MHEYEIIFFQKHLNSTQIFQKHIFESICPQKLKHKTQQIHAQYHVLSLAKNNL